MVYPIHKDLQAHLQSMKNGNYGLWYNKFIPIKDFVSCKASDARGRENESISHYCEQYKQIEKGAINELLSEKHGHQKAFCKAMTAGYDAVKIRAELETPLITGIGESHPNEVSMVFNHNLGIPYIPASGIKGIARFAHTLSLLFDDDENFTDQFVEPKNGNEIINDEDKETFIPQLFGTQGKRASVIFMDAYPERFPDLHIDIMNPHYGKYYADDSGKIPPADYLDPNPIKFLTIKRGTVFVFRALADKEIDGLADKVKAAFIKALTEEGIGAKTAVGYGFFKVLDKDIDLLGRSPVSDRQPSMEKERKAPESETWEGAVLSYLPNTGEFVAKAEGKNATTKDTSLIPEPLLGKLKKKKKKKPVTAKVTVELIGGKEYRLVAVSE